MIRTYHLLSILQGMPLRVEALWRSLLPKLHKSKEEHGVPRTNIMKYRLRGGCRALPFYFSQEKTPQTA